MGKRKPPVFPEPVWVESGDESKWTLEKRGKTYLGASHQIPSASDNGDGVLLDWGWGGIGGITDVLEEDGVEGRAGEAENRLRDAGASGLDGDVVVFLKVDTGVLLGLVGFAVELLFEAGVASADDVLAIAPGAEAEGGLAAFKATSAATAGGARPLAVTAAGEGGGTGTAVGEAATGLKGAAGGGRCVPGPAIGGASGQVVLSLEPRGLLVGVPVAGSGGGRRCSPLLVPQVRGDICGPAEAESGWGSVSQSAHKKGERD